MSQTFRHPDILEIARTQGKVTVEGLADHFGVSLQTIRRDLSDLAETGQLERVHGGAIVASGTVNIAYSQRRRSRYSRHTFLDSDLGCALCIDIRRSLLSIIFTSIFIMKICLPSIAAITLRISFDSTIALKICLSSLVIVTLRISVVSTTAGKICFFCIAASSACSVICPPL